MALARQQRHQHRVDDGMRIQPVGHQAKILEEVLRRHLDRIPAVDPDDIDRQPRRRQGKLDILDEIVEGPPVQHLHDDELVLR